MRILRTALLAVLLVAAAATLTTGCEPRTKRISAPTPVVLAAKPVSASVVTSSTVPAAAWAAKPHTISDPSSFEAVKAADGVWLYGDSISYITAADLTSRFKAAGSALAVNAWSSRPTTPAVDDFVADATRYGVPSRVIMALGTNDIFNPAVMPAQIERVMAAAGPTTTVYWVDVQIVRAAASPAQKVDDQRNSGWINVELQVAAARHPNLHVISWSSYLAAKPARLWAYLKDGVHPNAAGTVARDTMLVSAVK